MGAENEGNAGAGAGAAGGADQGGQPKGAEGGAQSPNGGEHMIPKSRLDEKNAELTALRAQVAKLVPGEKLAEIEAKLEETRQDAAARVQLVRSGVQSDAAADFLIGRYNALPKSSRPTFADWVTEIKASEPVFFAATANAADGKKNNPPPNTDAGRGHTPGGAADPPLTDELISKMDVQTYKRRRAEVLAYQRNKHR